MINAQLIRFIFLSIIFGIIFLNFPFSSGNFVSGNGGNWTIEDIQKYRQNATLNKMAIQNCTTFYNIEETTKFLNECTVAVANNLSLPPVKVRRSVEIQDVDQFTFLLEALTSDDEDGIRSKRQMIGDKEFLPSGLRIRVQNPWRIMETKAILENPCIGKCLLQKLGILDEKGQPQREEIITRVFNVLEVANGNRQDAIGITDSCIQRMEKRRKKENIPTMITDHCKIKSRFGICLSRESFTTCRDRFVGSATATSRRKPKSPVTKIPEGNYE